MLSAACGFVIRDIGFVHSHGEVVTLDVCPYGEECREYGVQHERKTVVVRHVEHAPEEIDYERAYKHRKIIYRAI